MRKYSGNSFDSTFFLQLSLGVFFIVLGILGLTQYSSKTSEVMRFFGKNNVMTLVVAIIQLLSGAVLAAGLFMSVNSGFAQLLSIAIFALWAFSMLMTLVVNGFLRPDLLAWLYKAAWNSVVLASLWIVGRKYMG